MADRVAGGQSTDPDVMRWCARGCFDLHHDPGDASATEIVDWVTKLGGEARYIPVRPVQEGADPSPLIEIRTSTGVTFLHPGQGLALTDEWGDLWQTESPRWGRFRVFRPVPAETNPATPNPKEKS